MKMWECHSYMSVLQEYLISVLHDSYQIFFSRTTWVVCSGHESNVRIADVFDPQLVGFAASSPVPHLLVTLTDACVIGPSAAFMPQFAIKRAPKLSKMNSSRLQGWNGICADLICPLDSMASLNQGSFVLEDHNSKFGRNLGEVNIKSAWKRGCRSLWSFTLQKDSWAFSQVLLLPWRSRAPLTMAVQFQFKSGRALGIMSVQYHALQMCDMKLETLIFRIPMEFSKSPTFTLIMAFLSPFFKKLRRTVLSLSLQSEPSGPVPSSMAPCKPWFARMNRRIFCTEGQ